MENIYVDFRECNIGTFDFFRKLGYTDNTIFSMEFFVDKKTAKKELVKHWKKEVEQAKIKLELAKSL